MLSDKELNKLRKYIEDEVKDLPDGVRVTIPDGQLLDALLFREINEYNYYRFVQSYQHIFRRAYYDCRGLFKVPVWSGSFLRKLDLSNVFFKDVVWNSDFTSACLNKKDIVIDFSDTNACINLIYSKKNEDQKRIIKGVNFSKTMIDYFEYVYQVENCDFSFCGLTSKDINFDRQVIRNCNFSHNDFSDVSVTVNLRSHDGLLNGNCYANTGIHIVSDVNAVDEVTIKKINDGIQNGAFDGCYLNGEQIFPDNRPNFRGISEYEQALFGIQEAIQEAKKFTLK